ncbi:hypothetical protein [uncultured Algimonas sp.]|uniref:hypothetical protein n=1 Tax=uncultured Algimonas sp. TaxID=1547920 RepID=UPI0026178678|nr:hypothetical protein [uncultured Algimonas sp.]
MSDIVRLHAPPFEPAAPTSLKALHRPLVAPDASHCEAHCRPCPACRAAQAAEVDAASKMSADLGLRLSQLVEDALAQHVARLEAEQAELVATILRGLLPALGDAALRSALAEELSAASQPLRSATLRLRKPPGLDLGPIPEGGRLQIEDDASQPMHTLSLADGDAVTTLDAQALIDACASRLGGRDPAPFSAEASQ